MISRRDGGIVRPNRTTVLNFGSLTIRSYYTMVCITFVLRCCEDLAEVCELFHILNGVDTHIYQGLLFSQFIIVKHLRLRLLMRYSKAKASTGGINNVE